MSRMSASMAQTLDVIPKSTIGSFKLNIILNFGAFLGRAFLTRNPFALPRLQCFAEVCPKEQIVSCCSVCSAKILAATSVAVIVVYFVHIVLFE